MGSAASEFSAAGLELFYRAFEVQVTLFVPNRIHPAGAQVLSYFFFVYAFIMLNLFLMDVLAKRIFGGVAGISELFQS